MLKNLVIIVLALIGLALFGYALVLIGALALAPLTGYAVGAAEIAAPLASVTIVGGIARVVEQINS